MKYIGITILSLIISFFLAGLAVKDLVLQIQFTFLGVIITALLEVLYLVKVTHDLKSREVKLSKIREKVDQYLLNIQDSFAKIVQQSSSANDLFVDHFTRKINDLSHLISDAGEKQVLRVTRHHFTSVENVMGAFQGEQDPVLRYVWILKAGEPLFDVDDNTSTKYFERTTKMVVEGLIKEVQAVLIVDGENDLSEPHIKKLLQFFTSNEGLNYRIVFCDNYHSACQESDISSVYIDFGIYGTKLMFRTESYEEGTKGEFTKDSYLINNYIKFFELIWSSPYLGRTIDITASEQISFSDLFDFDRKIASSKAKEGNS